MRRRTDPPFSIHDPSTAFVLPGSHLNVRTSEAATLSNPWAAALRPLTRGPVFWSETNRKLSCLEDSLGHMAEEGFPKTMGNNPCDGGVAAGERERDGDATGMR